jgi:hypothetical protein
VVDSIAASTIAFIALLMLFLPDPIVRITGRTKLGGLTCDCERYIWQYVQVFCPILSQ